MTLEQELRNLANWLRAGVPFDGVSQEYQGGFRTGCCFSAAELIGILDRHFPPPVPVDPADWSPARTASLAAMERGARHTRPINPAEEAGDMA